MASTMNERILWINLKCEVGSYGFFFCTYWFEEYGSRNMVLELGQGKEATAAGYAQYTNLGGEVQLVTGIKNLRFISDRPGSLPW